MKTSLKNTSFFSKVAPDKLAKIEKISQNHSFRKGEIILHQGDTAPGIFIVTQGLVRLYKVAANGKVHVLHLATSGMTFAEAAALGGFPVPANAEAVEKSVCALIPIIKFSALMDKDPALTRQIMVSMSLWVRHFVGQVESLVLRDAAGRVATYLLKTSRQEKTTLPSQKKHIASHLNLTSETLSRVLRQLKEQGLIMEDGPHIRIKNVDGLKQTAEGLFPTL